MKVRNLFGIIAGFLFAATLAGNADAAAHESRTIKPSDGTSTTTRVYAAFGDSIVAGYCGWFCRTDSYGIFYAKDIANAYDATVSYRGRGVSGDVMKSIADEVYAYRSDVSASDFVTIEGCGNDYLSARSSYRNQSDCTNETVLANALNTCQTHLVRALNTINTYKKANASVVVMNLYYPGVNSDKGRRCGSITHFDVFLDYIVESNWITCNEAYKRGFECADAFASFNIPDYDSDGDGMIDIEEVRFDPTTDIDDFHGYYTRVAIQNKHLIHDANFKKTGPSSTADYLQSDDTHPTAAGHSRLGREHTAVGF